jgi:MoaA/NifB/PqqE/SkfB family radical SAM enzyme
MANRLQKLKLPEQFCFAPYTNIDLDQSGGVLPCYRSKEFQGKWKQGHDLSDTINNENMQTLRQQLWDGEWPDSCRQCKAREENGVRSTRQEYNEHFLTNIVDKEYLDHIVTEIKKDPKITYPSNVHTMEIRPHGVCNLACAHCNQESSTRWISLLSEYENLEEVKDYFYIDTDSENSIQRQYLSNYISGPESLTGFFETATNVKHLHFTGGEPLLDKKHLEWLDIVPNKRNIDLRYHTNLQHRLYDKFFETWNKFNSLRVFASLDTSPHFYPYFRYGSDWNLVDENINAIKQNVDNVTIKATITVNFLTMLDWDGILDYIIDNDLEMHVAFVDPPHPISAVYLPKELKDKALVDLIKSKKKLKNLPKRLAKFSSDGIDKIEEFLVSEYDNQDMPDKTIDYFTHLDKIYNLKITNFSSKLLPFFVDK